MTANQPYDEQELLQRIVQSDEKAFHTIYQRYFAKVYAMSLHYMPDGFRAQDMVQEVFHCKEGTTASV